MKRHEGPPPATVNPRGQSLVQKASIQHSTRRWGGRNGARQNGHRKEHGTRGAQQKNTDRLLCYSRNSGLGGDDDIKTWRHVSSFYRIVLVRQHIRVFRANLLYCACASGTVELSTADTTFLLCCYYFTFFFNVALFILHLQGNKLSRGEFSSVDEINQTTRAYCFLYYIYML